MLGELGANGAIGVARVVRQSAKRAGSALRRRHKHVISGRHREHVRHRAAVTATRLAEAECTPGPRTIGVTRAEAPVIASPARPARDLKRHEDPLADATLADLGSNRDHVRHRLMPDRERPREETERCHRKVQITARHSHRPHKRTTLISETRIGNLFPGDPSGFKESKLPHRRSA
jgi:hypothetical protein